MSDSFLTLWTLAHQAPLLTGFSRQEYWSGFPCPPPGDLPDPGTEYMSHASPAATVCSSPLVPPENPITLYLWAYISTGVKVKCN